jgi:hypothetical protein
MAYYDRGNAIAACLYPLGEGQGLQDCFLPSKERTREMEPCVTILMFARMSFSKTAGLSSPHGHSCLLPIFPVPLVSGPESNSTAEWHKEFHFIFLSFLLLLEPP